MPLLLLTDDRFDEADQAAGLSARYCHDGDALGRAKSSDWLRALESCILPSAGEAAAGPASSLGLFWRVLQGFLLRADFMTKLRTALSGFALTP